MLVETTYQQQMQQHPAAAPDAAPEPGPLPEPDPPDPRELHRQRARRRRRRPPAPAWLCCRSPSSEGLVPTDEERSPRRLRPARADRAKKTLEEVKANADILAMQPQRGHPQRAADWVIEHSTIEDKAELCEPVSADDLECAPLRAYTKVARNS
ncbi:MAG: hypothetical protein ACLVJH_19170 [Faecalibacterium prausnitzii]